MAGYRWASPIGFSILAPDKAAMRSY